MENKLSGYSLGIDIGYTSVKVVLMDTNDAVVRHAYTLHRGKAYTAFESILDDILSGCDSDKIDFCAVTGSGGRHLARHSAIAYADETPTIVQGALWALKEPGGIIEIGAQSAKYITDFTDADKSRIKISMNSSCAAGTGAFLEEQASRLGLDLSIFGSLALEGADIPRIAGRCSVFAKTDITHHLQEGVPVSNILLGLIHAMVRNYRTAVMGNLPRTPPILFAGGVAQNQAVVEVLREELKLQNGGLVIPVHAHILSAIGAAVIARKEGITMDIAGLRAGLKKTGRRGPSEEAGGRLPPLFSSGVQDHAGKHDLLPKEPPTESFPGFLGIDVGSTSTNLVVSDANGNIAGFKYLRTQGDPAGAVLRGLRELKSEFGSGLSVNGVGVTGSGRHMIGRLVGADVVKDEITSQAKAALIMDPEVDTIFEIGGQDSKFIRLKNGRVSDFRMNKICAAGTGSFIEEQAKKFGIPVEGFGDMALSGTSPIHLGERCTVFMESSAASHLAGGEDLENIAAGLCYAVVKNYLNRVVGKKKTGHKIFFQGGLAYNQGVVNAFRALTEKEINVPPFFSVSGAYGVSILAREEMAPGRTRFKGFEPDAGAAADLRPDGEKKCPSRFDRQTEELIFHGYDAVPDPDKKTVGIPRALFTYGMFPMFHTFFRELGFNVLLSPPTSDETLRLGREYSLEETCYPVKLINGHVAQLMRKGVDYVFFPDLFTADHPGSHTRQNYGCAYMQLAFKIVRHAMSLTHGKTEFLSPTIAFNLGREFMMEQFAALGRRLGRKPRETMIALQKGMAAFHAFEERIGAHGKKILGQISPTEKAFVLVSKIYGIADPVLNLGIPDRLTGMGYPVLGFYHLPETDISADHPNMFWPFGQHILEPAHFIKAHPNLYAILLTHHGCGPDSVLTHYFREIMGEKPYLNIEVDEHASHVGVITRIEAFINSLDGEPVRKAGDAHTYVERISPRQVNICTGMAGISPETTVFLPNLYPYTRIFEKILSRRGFRAKAMHETDGTSIHLGREHILTNEYYSLTALLGDVLRELENGNGRSSNVAFLIPQTEGAEIDGQASRFIRGKLDEAGYRQVGILAPFIEDALCGGRENAWEIVMGLIAGDLVRFLPIPIHDPLLDKIGAMIDSGGLEIDNLIEFAGEVGGAVGNMGKGKKIFAIGEPLILFNDYLNDFSLHRLSDQGYRIFYAPLSEYLWLMWRDYAYHNRKPDDFKDLLAGMKTALIRIAGSLPAGNPFEPDPEVLVARADRIIGYYAGAFGRYRLAKLVGDLGAMDGIFTLSSAYENTGVSLDILRKGSKARHSTPVLNLTFDGNRNETDRTRIETFLYYL